MLKLLTWLINKLGYQVLSDDEFKLVNTKQETINDVLSMLDDKEVEIQGLLESIQHLQRRHIDENIIITSLISCMDEEEFTIKRAVIDEILKLGLSTIYIINKENDIVCSTKIPEQAVNQDEYDDICENCGGSCDECED